MLPGYEDAIQRQRVRVRKIADALVARASQIGAGELASLIADMARTATTAVDAAHARNYLDEQLGELPPHQQTILGKYWAELGHALTNLEIVLVDSVGPMWDGPILVN